MQDGPELESLETDLVSVADTYAARKGITCTACRDVGVPAEILRRADITRGTS